VLEIGKNSVKPSTTPSSNACNAKTISIGISKVHRVCDGLKTAFIDAQAPTFRGCA
jgi:hypothetical protein